MVTSGVPKPSSVSRRPGEAENVQAVVLRRQPPGIGDGEGVHVLQIGRGADGADAQRVDARVQPRDRDAGRDRVCAASTPHILRGDLPVHGDLRDVRAVVTRQRQRDLRCTPTLAISLTVKG
jgi:hypothetical protein